MIKKTFVESQKEEALKRLEKLLQNSDSGMTRERYFEMMEQLGQEPIEEEIPPSAEDLPDVMTDAINTFNTLGDRVYPEIGYTGKDYTNLPFFLKVYEVEDVEYFLDILSWLDSRAIKKASDQLKREYDKLKRNRSGSK